MVCAGTLPSDTRLVTRNSMAWAGAAAVRARAGAVARRPDRRRSGIMASAFGKGGSRTLSASATADPPAALEPTGTLVHQPRRNDAHAVLSRRNPTLHHGAAQG